MYVIRFIPAESIINLFIQLMKIIFIKILPYIADINCRRDRCILVATGFDCLCHGDKSRLSRNNLCHQQENAKLILITFKEVEQ